MHREGGRSYKAIQPPIGVVYNFLQKKARVRVWLYEQCNLRIEGVIIGFDEYMNLVLADACERHMKSGAKKPLGRILLKGETITLVQVAN
ncbi:unnamed protein product [Schistosoma guineensis]|uniref:Small nuclear ribonucleoprotein E n=2 Tax=Schistosoma TaxID=6181 RepID=A0AA85AKI3_9TREM|nr:unnamed protein product [Schistosoma mattheei]CAH8590564.1 unnamed protein product [Schistosoma intercalatum]CAH8603673.1 unnamed protein product [Schistosoma guineensis]CAH8608849.1 unnamed protein product [Schistosoma margrebowiei]CAH8615329.1 unnamed protein product [Schistosoma bovis]CAH8618796.1 unnamed protein product [Schistosoma haematobium]